MQISDVKKKLENILDKLSVDVRRIEVIAGDPHPFLSVTTSDSGILIGSQGENLRALNFLLKKMVEARSTKNEDMPSFLVDINGYHRRRMAELKQQAHILADRARTFKSDVVMDPINSYERMVVHAAFANDPEVFTESEGVGRNRHIIFKYKRAERRTPTFDRDLFVEEETR